MTEQELTHHGIKGMKWGVRRYQPYGKGESGRFLGKKSVSKKIQDQKDKVLRTRKDLTKATTKLNSESMGGLKLASKETTKGYQLAVKEYQYSKQDLKSVKILEKLDQKPKSKAQLKMEEKYKSKGMHADEAAVAAYQNLQTKKVLGTVGAVVVTAAVGYAAYKLHDDRIDKIIKSGDIIKNVAGDSNPVRDAFYATNKAGDHDKYKGLLAETMYNTNKTPYQKSIKVLSDIKQASAKNAHDVLKESMKDKSFAKDLSEHIDKWSTDIGINNQAMSSRFQKAQTSISEGKVDRNVYEVFNTMLVDHSPKMQKLTDSYYDKLKTKGYNAIRDVNDKKYSGYMAKNPIIVFGSKGKVEVTDVQELAAQHIVKARDKAQSANINKVAIKQGSAVAASTLAQIGPLAIVSTKTKQVMEKKAVDRYREKNPGSTMSNTEITRMLERSKI